MERSLHTGESILKIEICRIRVNSRQHIVLLYDNF